ncbi:MAG TPA: dTDP-4-dehydrorhamnose reductase [Rhodocyclaceae bacterium]|nr:dTDP-4-dehydrorhamnose reductase [Rhodocyclaceae bacterium]
MKILLLGKDGQVGWQLQRTLAPLGEVVACGRDRCDLADLDQVRRVVREVAPQVIVNAAAYTAVDKAETDAETARRVNAEAPGLLAEESARLGGLLIHYSTDYVYDGEKSSPYLETDPTSPQSVYGATKLAGEEAIRAAAGRAIIFRTSWVFGERGGNFVKTILRLAKDKESLTVVDDQVGSPTPAALISTVTGLALATLREGRGMEEGEKRLYHLAAARPVSWCEFARTIVRQASEMEGFELKLKPEAIRAIPSIDYPTPARRPKNSRLDCARLEQDFDLRMPDWQPYLERMLQVLSLR